MTIQKIIAHDEGRAARYARTAPKSNAKNIAKTDKDAEQKNLTYGQYTGLVKAGWIDKTTDYRR